MLIAAGVIGAGIPLARAGYVLKFVDVSLWDIYPELDGSVRLIYIHRPPSRTTLIHSSVALCRVLIASMSSLSDWATSLIPEGATARGAIIRF
jgi:hypothetical protein